LLGHIADAQYRFCSAVLGKPNPAPGIEKSRTAKQELMVERAARSETFPTGEPRENANTGECLG
jgi:hypothetical protein